VTVAASGERGAPSAAIRSLNLPKAMTASGLGGCAHAHTAET